MVYSFIVIPVTSFIPSLQYFPIPSIQNAFRGLDKLVGFVQRSVRDFQAQMEKEGDSFAKGTFLRNLIDARDAETGGSQLSFEDLVENTIIFLLAGSDTTAITSIYLLWECGKNPEVKRKLVEEIRTAFPVPNKAPTYEEASKLVCSCPSSLLQPILSSLDDTFMRGPIDLIHLCLASRT